MTLKTNNAEGGTDGTDVTTANSGGASGDAFVTVAGGATGALTFDSGQAHTGSLAYLMNLATAVACTMDMSDTAAATYSIRCYIRLNAYPSAAIQGPVGIRSAANASIGRLNLSATGQLQVLLGTSNNTSAFSTSVLALNTWYRLEVYGSGANTASTSMTCDVYVGDATGTPFFSVTLTGQTTVATVGLIRYGRIGTAGSNNWYLDDIAQNLGTATPLGPAINPVADAETATATDAGTARNLLTATDTAAATDAVSALVRSLTATDTATATDAAAGTSLAFTVTDGSALLETSTETVEDDGVDSSTLTEGTTGLTVAVSDNEDVAADDEVGLLNTAGTRVESNFESNASGTTLDTTNSNFSSVAPPTGSTLTVDNSVGQHMPGRNPLQVQSTAAVSPQANWDTTTGFPTTARTIWGRGYFYFQSFPAANTTILFAVSSTFSTMFNVRVTSSGFLTCTVNTAGTVSTGVVAIPLNQWFRVEFQVFFNASTGNATVKLFSSPDSVTPSDTVTATNVNTTNNALGKVGVGITNGQIATYWASEVGYGDATWLGPTMYAGADSAGGADAVTGSVVSATSADTATAADASTSRTFTAPGDTATAVDAGALALSSADTATGTDAASVSLVSADSASGADVALRIAGTLTDTATAVDAAPLTGLTSADTAAGVDAFAGITSPVTAADTAAGTDTSITLAAALAGADPASAADTASVAAVLAGAETATSVDVVSASVVAVPAADTAAGADTSTVLGSVLSSVDAATAVDAVGSINTGSSPTATETATAVDAPAGKTIVGVTDTATAVDAAGIVGVVAADTGTGTDAATVAAASTATDTAAVVDAADGRAFTLPDTASAVDTLAVYNPAGLDSAAGVDAVAASFSSASQGDIGTAAESALLSSATFFAADTASAVDATSSISTGSNPTSPDIGSVADVFAALAVVLSAGDTAGAADNPAGRFFTLPDVAAALDTSTDRTFTAIPDTAVVADDDVALFIVTPGGFLGIAPRPSVTLVAVPRA